MQTLEEICPDLPEWPRRWMGWEKDVPYGQALCQIMRPFIEHLIASGLAKRTIRNHLGNLWLLGGEIIREVNTHDEYDTAPLQKLKEAVGPDGGPYCRHLETQAELASFDATCRKLHRFLERNGR